ncbi:MAG: hypothetical protein Q8N53_17320 [Longimicrobiales bacterium]|nr:hypothetical protein [Longimicrobiales bacterium]
MRKRCRPLGGAQSPRTVLGVLAAVLALSGCSAPAVEGYQLQAPPEGFLYVVSQEASAGALTHRRAESQGVWYGDIKMDEPLSSVVITRYLGGAAASEVAGAREARAGLLHDPRYNRLGPLRRLAMADGGVASAWTEERHDEYGRFRSLQVTAVASYDTVSFSLELDTSVPERMTEAHLDSILASFALGRTVVLWKPVLGVAAAVGLAAAFLALRTRKRYPVDYRLARPEKPKPS